MQLSAHPTVRALEHRKRAERSAPIDASWLRAACLEAGADDVGFVSLDRPEIAGDRADIVSAFPGARTLVSFVVGMNRAAIRSPARSIANLEFHHAGDEVNDIARRIVATLDERGAEGLNPAMGFPMEMDRFPGKIWVVSHKHVAEAAGLGTMGVNRNLIHPKLGNFVLLGTVITDAEISEEGARIDYDPCVECKLCVAACPVGAISKDGRFDFSACYTHNYREFMGGFTDWVEKVADSKDALDYRGKVSDQESASMWQSLSFGANYKAAYCMSVCPAGEDVMGPFLDGRKQFVQDILRPLQDKEELVYVLPNADAEAHVAKRFPNKTVKRVRSGLRPTSIAQFLTSLSLVFQPGQARELDATYHFTFTGDEQIETTIRICRGALHVEPGHRGSADVRVTVDSKTWLSYLAKERGLVWPLLTRKLRISGKASLMKPFALCFAG